MAKRTHPLPRIECQVCGEGVLKRVRVYRLGDLCGVTGLILAVAGALGMLIAVTLAALAIAAGAATENNTVGIFVAFVLISAIPFGVSCGVLLLGFMLSIKEWILRCARCTAAVRAA